MTSIVFVNRASRFSGAEVVLLKLVQIACERGHRVRVVCPPGPLTERLPKSVEHFAIGEFDLGGKAGVARVLAAFTLIRRWIHGAWVIRRATTADSKVIVNSLLALPAVRLAFLPQGASWLVHDTVYESQQRAMIRIGKPAVRHAIAVSPPTAGPVHDLGVDVDVVPLGIDLPGVAARRGVNEPPVVGIMALLTPWKGHRVLLQAIAQVPGVRCEIAGTAIDADADYAVELQRLSEDPALGGRVRFLGHVNAVKTMATWDMLVNASTSPEASPVSALEAMSVQLPIIATDHGGSTWLLRDDAGVLIPPDDPDALATAIQWVVDNPDTVNGMVERAYHRVSTEHDPAVTYPAMLDALLGEKGSR
jgi:glycosyltransferase involved in cell wall biosynthesis